METIFEKALIALIFVIRINSQVVRPSVWTSRSQELKKVEGWNSAYRLQGRRRSRSLLTHVSKTTLTPT